MLNKLDKYFWGEFKTDKNHLTKTYDNFFHRTKSLYNQMIRKYKSYGQYLKKDRLLKLFWNFFNTFSTPDNKWTCKCAPLQPKKNVIQGTLHRISNTTSHWQSFDVALKKNQVIWNENQYPTEWSFCIVNETLDKTVTKEMVTAKFPKN